MYQNWLFGKDGALFRAAAYGQSDLLQQLIAVGANVNVTSRNGYTPLHRAAQKGHINCVAVLLQHGAEPGRLTKDKVSPADLAKEGGFSEVVAMLTSPR